MESRRSDSLITALRIPVLVAPMFLVSGPGLVVACCRSGVLGSFPTAYARTEEQLEEWLCRIERGLGERSRRVPYAANLIVHPSNPRVDVDLDLICRHRVPVVITSVGNPSRIVDRVHEYGGQVLSDVSRLDHAVKARDAGVDGLILLCAGAGGHTGSLNPFGFVGSVREVYDGPIVLAGSISTGRDIHAAWTMGADAVYMGTRFIAARESDAHDDYRDMVVRAQADDIVLTASVSGLPANWLKESLARLGFHDAAQERPEAFSADANLKAWRDIWGAGHGVGAVRRVETVAEIVDTLEAGYQHARYSG